MFKSMIQRYTAFLQAKPVLSRVVTTGLFVGTGDVLGQCLVEKKSLDSSSQNPVDWKRTARAVALGSLVIGPNLVLWHLKLMPRIMALPMFKGLSKGKTAAAGVFVDQLFWPSNIVGQYLFWVSMFEVSTLD